MKHSDEGRAFSTGRRRGPCSLKECALAEHGFPRHFPDMRMFKRLAVLGVILFTMAVASAYFMLPSVVLFPFRGRSPDIFKEPVPAGLRLVAMHLAPETGVTLEGFSMEPEKAGVSLPTVILLHGISSSKDGYAGLARLFCENGFRVVAFDSRGHGRSQGGCCTYGWHEKRDVSLIIDEIRKTDSGARIGIFGNSMGGAIALQAMAEDPRIECGVIESTFADFPEAACLRAESFTGFRVDPIVYPVLWRAAGQGHWEPSAVRPEESAKSIDRPVLLSHGTEDEVFPISHGERIFRNLRSSSKEWLPVRGGRHFGLGEVVGPEYEQRQIVFFKKWLAN